MWRVASASVIGTGHTATGMPCQDSSCITQTESALIVAVSDGLGSAAHSHVGAYTVCQVATTHVETKLRAHATAQQLQVRRSWLHWFRRKPKQQSIQYQQLCTEAFAQAREALVTTAQQQKHDLREYGCTLLLAIVLTDYWAVMHIGDGAVVGIYADDHVQTISTPDNGEFVNVTYPITAPTYLSQVRFAEKNETLHGIVLMSDGVQPMCINYKTHDAFPGFFGPLLQWFRTQPDSEDLNARIAAMLDTAQFRQKSDDDMTLVIALRQ
jgi:hypothetical protein